MLLSEEEARSICDQLLSYAKADDACVFVESESYSHLRFAANAFSTNGQREDTRTALPFRSTRNVARP